MDGVWVDHHCGDFPAGSRTDVREESETMCKRKRRIVALELAINYTPTGDDNHSVSVLMDMLDELRNEGGEENE